MSIEVNRVEPVGLCGYLHVSDQPVARTIEVEQERTMVDLAADGSTVGVETIGHLNFAAARGWL